MLVEAAAVALPSCADHCAVNARFDSEEDRDEEPETQNPPVRAGVSGKTGEVVLAD